MQRPRVGVRGDKDRCKELTLVSIGTYSLVMAGNVAMIAFSLSLGGFCYLLILNRKGGDAHERTADDSGSLVAAAGR